MKLFDEQPGLLCLAFAREQDSEALKAFERLFVFGLGQMLKFYTPIYMEECVSPENRVSLGDNPDRLDRDVLLHEIAAAKKCKTFLYGTFHPVFKRESLLERIEIRVVLYDLERQKTLLRAQYAFSAFDGPKPFVEEFAPAWDGLKDFITWLSCQVVGVLHPETSLAHWHRLQTNFFTRNIHQLEGLYKVCMDIAEDAARPESTLISMINKEPRFFAAQIELGYLHKRRKSYLGALQAMQSAWHAMAEVVPRQRALCASEIGVYLALLGKHEDACKWWKTAIKEDSTLIGPYLNIAHAMEEMNNLDEAEQYFKQVTYVAPEDKRAFDNLARLYSKMELWEKAIRQYEQQLHLEPENAWAYCNMANCYLQVEGIEEAKTYLVKTLALDPEGEAGRFANFVLSGLQAAEV